MTPQGAQVPPHQSHPYHRRMAQLGLSRNSPARPYPVAVGQHAVPRRRPNELANPSHGGGSPAMASCRSSGCRSEVDRGGPRLPTCAKHGARGTEPQRGADRAVRSIDDRPRLRPMGGRLAPSGCHPFLLSAWSRAAVPRPRERRTESDPRRPTRRRPRDGQRPPSEQRALHARRTIERWITSAWGRGGEGTNGRRPR